MIITWTARSLDIGSQNMTWWFDRPYPNPNDPRWILSPYSDGTQGRFALRSITVHGHGISSAYAPGFQIKTDEGWVGMYAYREYISSAVLTVPGQSRHFLSPDHPAGEIGDVKSVRLDQVCYLFWGQAPFAVLTETWEMYETSWAYEPKLTILDTTPFSYLYWTGLSSRELVQVEWGWIGQPPDVTVVNEPIPQSVYTKRDQGFNCLRGRYDWGNWAIMNDGPTLYGYDAHFGPGSSQEGALSAWYIPGQMISEPAETRSLQMGSYQGRFINVIEV